MDERLVIEKFNGFGGKLGCGLFENLSEVSKIASECNAVDTLKHSDSSGCELGFVREII